MRPALRLPLTNQPLQTPLAPLLAGAGGAGGNRGKGAGGVGGVFGASTQRFATMERFLHDTRAPTQSSPRGIVEEAEHEVGEGEDMDVTIIDPWGDGVNTAKEMDVWEVSKEGTATPATAAAAPAPGAGGGEMGYGQAMRTINDGTAGARARAGAGAGGGAGAGARGSPEVEGLFVLRPGDSDPLLLRPPVPGARMVEWTGTTGKLWRQWLAPAPGTPTPTAAGAAPSATSASAAALMSTASMVPLCLACKVPYDEDARARYGRATLQTRAARKIKNRGQAPRPAEALRKAKHTPSGYILTASGGDNNLRMPLFPKP